jgi:phosphoglycerate dehydrogenase-like enzyme
MNHNALDKALQSGRLSGFAIDIFNKEPPSVEWLYLIKQFYEGYGQTERIPHNRSQAP